MESLELILFLHITIAAHLVFVYQLLQQHHTSPVHALVANMAKEEKASDRNFTTIVEEKFKSVDRDDKGFVTWDDWMYHVVLIKQQPKIDEKAVGKFEEVLKEAAYAIGLSPGVEMTKEMYVENVYKFAVKDHKSYKEGKGSLHHRLHDAIFDVVDLNKDGTLSLEEVEAMFRIFHSNYDKSVAKEFFELADTNKNGKIERQEFLDVKFKWFDPANI